MKQTIRITVGKGTNAPATISANPAAQANHRVI
jgi:hypothetical protein